MVNTCLLETGPFSVKLPSCPQYFILGFAVKIPEGFSLIVISYSQFSLSFFFFLVQDNTALVVPSL